MNNKTGALIALAAGGLFAAACKKEDGGKPMAEQPKPMAEQPKSMADEPMAAPMAKPDETMAKVHCSGVNACKGHGGCKSEANACAGKNGCAGKGWVELTEADCKAKNGTVLATK